MAVANDTICAVATPAGRGGVSIIRVSGPACREVCVPLGGPLPAAGRCSHRELVDADGSALDQCLLLFFAAPRSFTGEDVCEFHVHGSPVIAARLLECLCANGARLARPGEFSERAFLNDKIDLAQAEAIADLVNSASLSAARFALRSLQGEFSQRIELLLASLIEVRVYVEAALDFPDEEVEFLESGAIDDKLQSLSRDLSALLGQARQGTLIRDGIRLVIAGEPNAGKSTLLNALTGEDSAIVTDIPGTTRDILQLPINLDGLPLHVLDTAGLRDSADPVEQEGIRRAWKAVADADLILLLVDAARLAGLTESAIWTRLQDEPGTAARLCLVINKTDLTDLAPGACEAAGMPAFAISAKLGLGLDELKTEIKSRAGFAPDEEGGFIARQRHVDALQKTLGSIDAARQVLATRASGELVAEELRGAQQALGEITGKFTSDDLLGSIFSSFCIGK